jgi:Tfp pilus assembly protein PilF
MGYGDVLIMVILCTGAPEPTHNTRLHTRARISGALRYKLIDQERPAEALELFKLNVFIYPTSANAFESLGEIYAIPGDTKLAIKNYEQSLKLHHKTGMHKGIIGRISTTCLRV